MKAKEARKLTKRARKKLDNSESYVARHSALTHCISEIKVAADHGHYEYELAITLDTVNGEYTITSLVEDLESDGYAVWEPEVTGKICNYQKYKLLVSWE